MDLLLGIDIGTGSSKGALVDAEGTVLASETMPHNIQLPRPGWVEADAEGTWWHEVSAISSALTAQLPQGGRVAAKCVSGVGPCLVLGDDDLQPLRPAILYGIDSRASAEIEFLETELVAEQILDRAGTVLSSQAVGPKLEWVYRHGPAIFQRARRWYGSNSYIAAKLTGEYVLDHHTASQCEPLYVTRSFEWNTEWAQRICRHLPMPRLVWPSDVVGEVHAEAVCGNRRPPGHARRCRYGRRLRRGILGRGSQTRRSDADVRLDDVRRLGYRAVFQRPRALDYRRRGTQYLGTGGGHGHRRQPDHLAADRNRRCILRDADGRSVGRTAGQRGLVVLPYFAGERTPVFDSDARGVFAGLTLRHGRVHLCRAACEGISSPPPTGSLVRIAMPTIRIRPVNAVGVLLQKACERGGSSFYGTGMNPGINQVLGVP